MPRLISCLPMFGCSKLFCETSLLPLEDEDSFGEFCCCWGCCSGNFLQFRRNFVRKPLSGGYAGYYRPLIRTHPRFWSLLLYHMPMERKKQGKIDCQYDFTNIKMKLVVKFFFIFAHLRSICFTRDYL